jgi:GT2 family glycosyltransferase
MSAVSSADYSSFDSDFARAISQRFEHGRFLVIGGNSRELESQFAEAGREAEVWSPDELASKPTQDTGKARFQMLTRREIFQEVEGFDTNLSGALADVDLCLKIGRAGYLIVYTLFSQVYWHDAPGKIDIAGREIMEQRWAGVLHGDPYYNPNLSRERADFSIGK